jgi:hypothetical protein
MVIARGNTFGQQWLVADLNFQGWQPYPLASRPAADVRGLCNVTAQAAAL